MKESENKLTPISEQVTSKDVAGARRWLRRIVQDPNLFDQVDPETVGKLLRLAEAQYPQVRERMLLFEQRRAAAATRRAFMFGRAADIAKPVTFVGITSAAVLWLASTCYRTTFSPEASRDRANWEQQQRLLFEQKQSLGLEPTAVSRSFWRVSYPKADPRVDYVVMPGDRNFEAVPRKNSIRLIDPVGYGTYIFVTDRLHSSGDFVPLLSIDLSSGHPEEWTLRDRPTPEIDTRVVQFEHIRKGQIKYLQIKRTKASTPSFEVREMERVQNLT